jgi:hypothetical protein
MAAFSYTPPQSINTECVTCNATRNLVISFNTVTPAPTNGYIVKWKRASQNTFTQVSPNPTSSPVTVNSIPACEDINVSVQSSCGPGFTSTEVTSTVTGLAIPLKCGCGYEGNIDIMTFYAYPFIALDFSGIVNGSLIKFGYNSVSRINRFDIYNVTDGTTATTSDWAGAANYPGPWGATINTPATGTIQFVYNSAKTYQLRVVVGAADPSNQLNDNWSISMACSYYYTGILCGGSIQQAFRSTTPNLDSTANVVKVLCAACGNTEQCFDNISTTTTPNSNDLISTHADCSTCGSSGGSGGGSGGGGATAWDCVNGNCVGVVGGAYTDYTTCVQNCSGGGGQPQQ